MMHLRCPNCHAVESISELHGAWWATCQTCGHTIKVVGLTHSSNDNARAIQCPKCKYREEYVVLPNSKVQITCPACSHQFHVC